MSNQKTKMNTKSNREGKASKNSSRPRSNGDRVRYNNSNSDDNSTYCSSDGSHNDPRFYYLNDDVGNQMSNVSFSQFTGVPIHLDNKFPVEIPNATFMRLLFNPSVGRAVTFADAANMAGLKLFSTLSANNGRTTQYAPQDVTTLLLALSSLIEVVEVGRRAFGFAYTINVRNRSFPKKAIEVMGFNPDEFLDSLANKRMEFNYYINSINKIAFPANIALFSKSAEMYSDVFTDDQSSMAQIYVPLPYSVWMLDEDTYDQGTILHTHELFTSNNTITWTEYVNTLDLMISRILGSATYNYIYADVLRLAEKSSTPLLHLDIVEENYSKVPVYDIVKLIQYHNAVATGAPNGKSASLPLTPGNDVYPAVESNGIYYQPYFSVGSTLMASDKIFDFGPYDNPDKGVILDASRYMLASEDYTTTDDTTFVMGYTVLPDHYLVAMELYTTNGTYSLASSGSYAAEWPKIFLELEKFDWAPRIYVYDTNTSRRDVVQITGDIGHFTTLDSSYLNRINDLSIQALLEVR